MTLTLEKLLNREKGAEPALIVFATWRIRPKIYGGRSLVKHWGSKHHQSTTRLVGQQGRRNRVYALVARDAVPLLATASPWGMEGTVGETDMAGGVSQVDQRLVI